MSTAILEQQPVETVPEKETEPTTTWKYLAPRPESRKKQLFFKDSRMTAATIPRDMLTNGRNVEETAENWDLPVEAVLEAIRYCAENGELIDQEAEAEKQFLLENGMILDPKDNPYWRKLHEAAD